MKQGKRLAGTPNPMHMWNGADGVSIAGDAWGDPGGPLIVLLHGGGQTRHAWGATGEMLGGAGYFAVAIDARGHGDSTWSAGWRLQRGFDGPRSEVRARGARRTEAGADRRVDGRRHQPRRGRRRPCRCERADTRRHRAVQRACRGRPKSGRSWSRTPKGSIHSKRSPTRSATISPQRHARATSTGCSRTCASRADGTYQWHWDPRFIGAPVRSDTAIPGSSACCAPLDAA